MVENMVRGIFRLLYWGAVAYGIWTGIVFIFAVPTELVSKYALSLAIVVFFGGSGIAFTIDKKLFGEKLFSSKGISQQEINALKYEFAQYRQDEIEEIKWYWEYIKGFDGKLTLNNLIARCPNCNTLLIESNITYDPVSKHTFMATFNKNYICDNCGFHKQFDIGIEALKEKVLRVIDRKIMNREYLDNK